MPDSLVDRAKRFIRSRTLAYRRVFHAENLDVQVVLADLAKFCRATDSTFVTDARAHALLEGRREVWLRISEHLNLTVEELYRKKNPD